MLHEKTVFKVRQENVEKKLVRVHFRFSSFQGPNNTLKVKKH